MENKLSVRIDQADEHLFLLLGALPDKSWHHRIIRAPDALSAHRWWTRQTGSEPDVVLVHHELEAALAGLIALTNELGTDGLWGGWFVSDNDSTKVEMVVVSADDYQQAHDLLLEDPPPGYSLAMVVEATPWIAEIARMRAIAANELGPDEVISTS